MLDAYIIWDNHQFVSCLHILCALETYRIALQWSKVYRSHARVCVRTRVVCQTSMDDIQVHMADGLHCTSDRNTTSDI